MLAAILAASVPAEAGGRAAIAAPPWQKTLDALAARRDRLSREVALVHDRLLARVEKERPDLLPKIKPTPPKPWPTGYGILPRLDPDPPEEADPNAAPAQRRYSLKELSGWISREETLSRKIDSDLRSRSRTLDALADDYLLRAENARRIDEHIKYHALWQKEIWKNPEFGGANQILAEYRLWRSTPTTDAQRERAAEARTRLESEMVSFSSTPWHHIVRQPDGSLLLRLALQTDIGDEAYLAKLAYGVERVWNDAPAMRAARLRFEIEWEPVAPDSLYPEGVPRRGEKIDASDHLRRFPPGFVLTTGGESLHVLGGRGIILGGAPITCHTLAHETSHLLGFEDGYLRAYEGSPDSADGAVILEVTPFPGDILSDSGAGRVSGAMVRDLIGAYLH